jgi:hypothetical protein
LGRPFPLLKIIEFLQGFCPFAGIYNNYYRLRVPVVLPGRSCAVLNSKVDIKVVQSGRDRRRFIDLPWMIYKNDPNWIPPLLSDMRNTLKPGKNALLSLGHNRFYIALCNGVVVGRLGVGRNNRLNEAKKQKLAYITLFESIKDYKVYRVYQMPL